MRGAVEDNGRFDAWTGLAPHVDAIDASIFEGLACEKDARVVVVGVPEPYEKPVVESVAMVAFEPVPVDIRDCAFR